MLLLRLAAAADLALADLVRFGCLVFLLGVLLTIEGRFLSLCHSPQHL